MAVVFDLAAVFTVVLDVAGLLLAAFVDGAAVFDFAVFAAADFVLAAVALVVVDFFDGARVAVVLDGAFLAVVRPAPAVRAAADLRAGAFAAARFEDDATFFVVFFAAVFAFCFFSAICVWSHS